MIRDPRRVEAVGGSFLTCGTPLLGALAGLFNGRRQCRNVPGVPILTEAARMPEKETSAAPPAGASPIEVWARSDACGSGRDSVVRQAESTPAGGLRSEDEQGWHPYAGSIRSGEGSTDIL